MKRIISLLLILIIMILPISGCGQSKAKVSYNLTNAVASLESQPLAENDNLSLSWNQDKQCVIFENKLTGKKWCNIPYDAVAEDSSNVNLNSTLNITVVQLPHYKVTNVNGYTASVENGRVGSKKIKDGIVVIYYFDDYKISIPVNYRLKNDSLEISVNSKAIIEGDPNYQLVSVAIAPFLCSANNLTPDSYLFVPSGTGALMYAGATSSGTKKYVGELYGEDLSKIEQTVLYEKEKIRMPIFGVKDGNDGLLGVISENSITTEIVAESGNKRLGYSNIYPVFYYRGYDVLNQNVGDSNDYIRYSEIRSIGEAKVTYFALSDEQANYNGMAFKYREYLKNHNLLKDSSAEQKNYSLTFIGGVETTTLKLGFKANEFLPATTFSEAKQIIDDLNNETNKVPSVRLMGFGENGIEIGKIAGGYTFASKLGTKEQRLELEDYCKEQNIDLYSDFDLIRYAKSGNGFSYNFDSAKTAILKRAERFEVNIPIRSYNEESGYRLLKRSEVFNAVNKLSEFAEKNKIGNISLSSLTSNSYSDYENNKYFVKGSMASDVKTFISNLAEKKHLIAVSGANSYAANISDSIYDVTLTNGNNFAFDKKVPVYQMIYSGAKPMYSEAVNYSSKPEKEIIYAVSTGIGVGFTIINNYYNEFANSNEENLYATLYQDNREIIINTLKKYSDVYDKISGSSIENYDIDENGLSITKFDNGFVLYANHSNKSIVSPIGEVGAYEIKF